MLCRSISCLRHLHIRTRTGLNSRSGQLVWRPLRGERFTQVPGVSHARNAYAADSARLLQERCKQMTKRSMYLLLYQHVLYVLGIMHAHMCVQRTYTQLLHTSMSVHYIQYHLRFNVERADNQRVARQHNKLMQLSPREPLQVTFLIRFYQKIDQLAPQPYQCF